MLRAKPETTRCVNAHARIDVTGGGQESRSNVSRGAVVARSESACELGRRRDEFCWSHEDVPTRMQLTNAKVQLQASQIGSGREAAAIDRSLVSCNDSLDRTGRKLFTNSPADRLELSRSIWRSL